MARATRRTVLAAAGGAAAAAGAVGLIAGGDDRHGGAKRVPVALKGATSRTTDRFGLGDAGIANFLLTLQRVEADLYEHAVGRALFREFAAQEREHAARLERAVHDLGTHAVAPPRTRRPSGGAAAFVQYARTAEDLA